MTEEGRHLETSQHCCNPCCPCRAGIFHIKLLCHPEIPNCSFSFLKYFQGRGGGVHFAQQPCGESMWGWESGLCVSSDDHQGGLIRWNMWLGWKVSPFLLSKVGCMYLGMHELWESGNLMLESFIGNIPLQGEWSRNYTLYSLHLSVIWINWVLMVESWRCFSSYLTFFFSSSQWCICTRL